LLTLCLPFAAHAADSAACAQCHREIYESYRRTPMAASSGPIGGGLIRETFDNAAFTHSAIGFRYRILRTGAGLFVDFQKVDGTLHGRKLLSWFVGSGATARSYIVADNQYLFEAPVAYYTASAKWALAPAYDSYAYPFLTRAIQPGCLTCHASFLQPIAPTQNRYDAQPFREGGVACERCHGPGERHIASGAPMLNPAKLPPAQRDSICAQCHLSGEARVMQPGRDWQSFHPGERLSDTMTIFVKASRKPGMTVTGHVEKLAQSACKQASGDKLWCGTCHNPHAVPSATGRAAWFRAKCLGCHASAAAACKETQAARLKKQDDCTACHMPKSTVVDASHVVYTDHSIPRRPRTQPTAAAGADLVPFGGVAAAPRDLALAYAIARNQTKALPLLEKAEESSPNDVEVLLYLAEIYRNANQYDSAVPLYQRAMRLDPTQVTASAGLGAILMERGRAAEAIPLWEDALAKSPGLVLVRTNLAMAYLRTGDAAAAERHLVKAVELSPAFAAPADLLRRVREQLPK